MKHSTENRCAKDALSDEELEQVSGGVYGFSHMVQNILASTYHEASLSGYAARVSYFNSLKASIRDEISSLRSSAEVLPLPPPPSSSATTT